MAAYGRGQMLGVGIDPRLMAVDYSPFVDAEWQEIAAQKLPAYVFHLMEKICILIYKIGAKLSLLLVTGIKSF